LNRIADVIRIGCGETLGSSHYSPPPSKGEQARNHGVVGVATKAELWQTLGAGPSDLSNSTLVCYLKLHGGTNAKTQEHYFELDGSHERVSRTEVLRFLRDRGARFTVLITDSCSMADIPTQPTGVNAVGYPKELFESLFLAPPGGYVDINSSTYRDETGQVLNQYAWMDEVGNAIFTQAFAECFSIRGDPQAEMLKAVRVNGQITWRSFVDGYLRGQTDAKFRDLKVRALQSGRAGSLLEDQQHQFPMAFHLP